MNYHHPNLSLGQVFAVFALVCSLSGQIGFAQETNFEEISSLATGGKFYVDKDTFQPIGNGKLQYNVIGSGNGTGERVSVNEIDCASGQFKSPLESWVADTQGQASSRLPGPQGPTSVSKRTKLHGILKDACNQHLPNTKGDW